VESTGLTLTVLTGREIASIAGANARLYKEANESLKMRDEFLSIASHELKNPLTSLSLQLQMIHQIATKPSTPDTMTKILKLSDQTLGATNRLSNLLEELLDLTRIRVGRLEIHRGFCNLSHIVQDAVVLLGAEAAKRGSAMTINSDRKVEGHFDAIRMSQVVINLLSNAIKYGQGKPITVSVEALNEKARITVQDHGMGISAEKIPMLFQRFERIEQNPSIQGLGLGLYISNEIVKAHHGTLIAESQVGKGTTFVVELSTRESGSCTGSASSSC
jgi:signal transduction histidine kinase